MRNTHAKRELPIVTMYNKTHDSVTIYTQTIKSTNIHNLRSTTFVDVKINSAAMLIS